MKIETEISSKYIADLLVGAFEGGSNYWYHMLEWPGKPKGADYWDWMTKVLDEGKGVVFALEDKHEADDKIEVTPESIRIGLNVMREKAPRHFGNMAKEGFDPENGGIHTDADTSDALLQCICFGEIVYG